MYSKLIINVDDFEIEFHLHELVWIAQKVVAEVPVDQLDMPSYKTYSDDITKKFDSFMKDGLIQYEQKYHLHNQLRISDKHGEIEHPLVHFLNILNKTSMTYFLINCWDSFAKLLDIFKSKQEPILQSHKIDPEFLLPLHVKGMDLLASGVIWLII